MREGAIGAAIGIAGIRHAGEPAGDADLFGNASKPMMNRVDEIASAASILMGQTGAARPVDVGRGVPYTVDENASIARLLTPPPDPGADGSRAPAPPLANGVIHRAGKWPGGENVHAAG